MLRTQIKMELVVYTQDSTYSHSLSALKREEDREEGEHGQTSHRISVFGLTLISNSDNHATLQELMRHLKSYYSVSGGQHYYCC